MSEQPQGAWVSDGPDFEHMEAGPFVLMLMLEPGGATVANLRAHPQVAVMLQHGDAFALFAQAHGHARVVDDDPDADAAYRRAISVKAPEGAQLVAIPSLVPVRIEIDRWRLTDVPAGWLPAREVIRPGVAAGA